MMISRLILVLVFAVAAFAQSGDPCLPEGCRTQTMGGWGGTCSGNNPGCVRDNNFATAFPSGLTIGDGFTLHFSTSTAVRDFLPAGGTAGVLTGNHVDPASTEAGVFAGQVTALAMTLGFSNSGVSSFCDLGGLYYLSAYPWSGNPFVGMTVQELFDLANEVLGGNTSALPAGTSASDLSDVIAAINENFVDGEENHGHLVTEDCDIRLAVELASFSGVARDGEIELSWNTASESDVERFEIERSVNGLTALAGIVDGQGDSPLGHSYSFVDQQVIPGAEHTYRLVEVSFDGARHALSQTVTIEASTPGAVPAEFALYQNYPNPFNPNTQISFALPEASKVSLVVFDALGRQVTSLVSGYFAAGTHNVSFDAANLSAGLYFYQISAGEFTAVRKMMLIK